MQQTCPNCDRHCPIDNLHCGRGREYFGLSDRSDHGMEKDAYTDRRHERHHGGRMSDDPRIIQLLRRCGHALHHGDAGVARSMLDGLSSREQSILEQLLEKCLDGLPERTGRH